MSLSWPSADTNMIVSATSGLLVMVLLGLNKSLLTVTRVRVRLAGKWYIVVSCNHHWRFQLCKQGGVEITSICICLWFIVVPCRRHQRWHLCEQGNLEIVSIFVLSVLFCRCQQGAIRVDTTQSVSIDIFHSKSPPKRPPSWLEVQMDNHKNGKWLG